MIKLKVRLDDGEDLLTEVEEFDAKKIADELNSTGKNMYAIGDLVVQRFSVIRVTKAKEEDTEE